MEPRNEQLQFLDRMISLAQEQIDLLAIPKSMRRRKTVHLALFLSAIDLCQSIQLLLKQDRVNAALGMIRSLQENELNIRFLYSTPSFLWTDSYLNESEYALKKFADDIRILKNRYGNDVAIPNSYIDEKILRQGEVRADRHRRYMDTKYQRYPHIPGLTNYNPAKKPYNIKEKCIILDYYNHHADNKALLRRSDFLSYTTTYWRMSGAVHQGASHIATNIVGRTEQGLMILESGDKRRVPLYAWTTAAIVLDLLTSFVQVFRTTSPKTLRPYIQQAIDASKLLD